MVADPTDPWFREAYGAALAALQRGDAQAAGVTAARHSGPLSRRRSSLRVLGVALLTQGRRNEAIS